MSLNQSRAEKSEAQVRKPGRSGSSNYQRSSSGGAGKGGSGTAPPPSPSISSSPSLSTNRGFKKSGNGQGGQSKVGPASTNSEPNAAVAANRAMQNGTHVQSHVHGVSDVPVSVTAKPIDSSVPRSSRSLPKAPSSQTTSGASDSAVPATPSKGDAPRAFPLQFGTINPGFMNGMQIPARTSSAPPNLDEQKRDQACHNSVRGVPTMPIPPVLKQQQMRKDVGSMNQSNTASSHPQPQAKRDIHIPIPAAPAATAQKSSVLPMTGMSMPMPFQQPQVPIQFGGPTPQIQSQGVTAPSLQMLPVGNAAQVQRRVFVPSFQSHPWQPPGMMHQGQSLGFTPQMGHQMVPQLGNLGIGMPLQFVQQQAGKFGAPQKAVKITHLDTNEKLKLDNKRTDSHLDVGSSGPRSHPNVPPQSQPIPSFLPAHSINYYPIPNSYNSAPIFFQPSSSLPLTGSQMTPSSSASRHNYSVGQGGQAISFMNPSAINPLPVSKAGPPIQGMSEPVNVERTHDGHVMVSAPTASVQVTVKPSVVPLAEKACISSVAVKSSAAASPAVSMHIPPSSTESVPVAPAESTSVASNAEGRRKESIRRSDSFKDQHKKPSKKEPRHSQQQHQVPMLHKGLIPSPQTPLQVMHKAEKKYEVGKVSDQEEAKQRQLKGILNKLRPQNFEKLFQQVKEVNIDNAFTLTGVILQIFDKILTEPTFCEMYANFCFHLAGELPDFSEDNEKITFKRLLLNKCQEEFERGKREQPEANRAEEEGEIKQSKEEREEKKVKARRRMLGNIRLIGELYKKRMLTERIMHECIKKLLGQYQNPDEEDVEALCELMSAIGEMIDHPKAKEHMDAYFDMMLKLSNNQKLSSRVRFMLRDAIDLRKNKWQQRRKWQASKILDQYED